MNWKDNFRKLYSPEASSDPDPERLLAYNGLIDKIIEDISELLKEQREKYYYHIENSSGTKEADYIDKMVNAPEPSEPKGDVE